jgi:hypothetical protein
MPDIKIGQPVLLLVEPEDEPAKCLIEQQEIDKSIIKVIDQMRERVV